MQPEATAIILGGGQGKRLFPLTRYRSKPAVPIGGKYRLVDIPISNAINSGIHTIFVLTQFNSTSLHRHIHRTYPYEIFTQTSVELLAAEQTLSHTEWFQGTADAVRKHMTHFRLNGDDTVLILSGDHLYRMDYRNILRYHHEKGADVTISTVPVPKNQTRNFGIMQISSSGEITSFVEKPSPSENIRSLVIPQSIRKIFNLKGGKKDKDLYLASMGVYVFKAKVLEQILAGRETDFGKEVIPKSIGKYKVFGYVFDGYWRDIGTIQSFYEASLELTKPNARFSFLSESRIFTRPRFLPPSRITDCKLNNALISEGLVMDGAEVNDSIIGLRSAVGQGSTITRSILMGNDYYDWEKPSPGPHLGIGKGCRIENCILDKNVRVGDHVQILNAKKIEEADGPNYHIREGIVIIPKDVAIPSGTQI